MKLDLLANSGLKEEQRPAVGPHGFCDESGQDLIEYALLTSVLSVGFIGMIQALANGMMPFFNKVLAVFQSL